MSYNSTASLIIPSFNEENTTVHCVEKVCGINEKQDFILEIVIINDHFTSKSAEKLSEISKKYPEIRIFFHNKKFSNGTVLKIRPISAICDCVNIQDAGNEYNPIRYWEMLKSLWENRTDVVFGSRYLLVKFFILDTPCINKSLTIVSNTFNNLYIFSLYSRNGVKFITLITIFAVNFLLRKMLVTPHKGI